MRLLRPTFFLLLFVGFVLSQPFSDKDISIYGDDCRCSYEATNAVFNGNSQYMKAQADYSDNGIANTTTFTFSGWVNRSLNNSNAMILSFGTTAPQDRFYIYINAGNVVQTAGISSGAATVFAMVGSNQITVASGWTHIYVCANLADATQTKIYINGIIDATNAQTRVNTAIQFEGLSYHYYIGRYAGSALNFFNGAMSELWWNDTYLDDPTKFIQNGCPISLGANGETPTGAQPAFYFKGGSSGFHVSSGTAGGVAEPFGITNGPLTSIARKCN